MVKTKYQRFEDLIIWKESMSLCFDIYAAIKTCRDFALRSQVQRSIVSVASNIAEGFERQTDKEFIQYLYIAKGSCGELRTQLYILAGLEIINKLDCNKMIDRCFILSSLIQKFITAIKSSTIPSN